MKTIISFIRQIPGFRHGKLSNMIVAVAGYYAIIQLVVSAFQNREPFMGFVFLVSFIFFVSMVFNFKGLRSKVPGFRSGSPSKTAFASVFYAFIAYLLLALGASSPNF